MFTSKYWNERANKSGNNLRTVMKHSFPDFINQYFDKKQIDFISSINDMNESILEVGCGFGRLIRSLENSNHFIGVDFSKEMLLYARNNINSPIVLAQGSMLPFKKNSFDRVLCVTVLIHIMTIDEIKKVLNEMDYVLKNGGVLVIGEMGYVSYHVQKLLLRLGIAKHAMALDPILLKDMIEEMKYSIIKTKEIGVFPIDVYFIVARKCEN